ncbi:unnamed protein product [Rotaria magnacalcarata]|uniref:Transposase Tc1-like domain-containing protein n=1 Tax=Rotaria magnacalcarata TaxID=392030 RepID=A0A819IN18_9BILA|nr:unnamed protein product [Rotaria magnacalcarata]
MASRKKNEYTNDLRKLVINHFLNGDSKREIVQKTFIPRTSILYIIAKYKSTKCLGNIIDRGRKRKTTAHVDCCIRRKLNTNRRISSSTIKVELQSELSITISESAIKRRPHEAAFCGRVAKKKSYINRLNRTKRLEYARAYQKKPLGFWNDLIWLDKSKFNLFGSDGKHGGESVMCWGCFSSSGVDNLVFIDENMTGEAYRDVLDNSLLQSVKNLKLNKDWVFQHDNDPKHRAAIVTN